MVKIIFLRHGYSMFNKTKQFTGHLDIALEPEGYEQAKDACRYIYDTYKVDKIYSSDLVRAVETVRPLADKLGLDIIKTELLREMNLGKWQGEYIEEIPKLYPEDYKRYRESTGKVRVPGGESYEDMVERVKKLVAMICASDDTKTVVCATHGGFTRAMLWSVYGTDTALKDVPIIPNASITVVNYENGKGTLELLGYNEYLSDKEKNTLSE